MVNYENERNLTSLLPTSRMPIRKARILDTDRFMKIQEKKKKDLPDLIKKDREERFRKHEQLNQTRWEQAIPRRWKKARISNFDGEAFHLGERIVHGVKNGNPLSSFVVWSPVTGNGKTFFGYAVLNELRSAGLATLGNVGFFTEKDVADAAISGFERDDKLNDMLLNKKFIFIDDVSNRSQYGWGKNNDSNRAGIWFDILDFAYSKGVNIFLTSNQSPNGMRRFMGDTAFERLWHITANGDNILELTRSSFRASLAEEVKRYYGNE